MRPSFRAFVEDDTNKVKDRVGSRQLGGPHQRVASRDGQCVAALAPGQGRHLAAGEASRRA
jgi:hypothetical protein